MTSQPEPDLFSGESHLVPVPKPGDASKLMSTVADPIVVSESPPVLMEHQVDMRSMMMTLPPKQQESLAKDYIDRRNAFRTWLKSRLVEGVHFGYPPKLAPKFDKDGNQLVSTWNKKANGGQGGYETTVVSPKSWTAKPSLYKAGADFVCDLLAVRDEYEADMAGWEQLGKKSGMFVYACRLYSRANNDLLGEGRGVREVGQKGGDANNAIKMAKKSAKVDAVLNAFGLSDLFTQDIEDQHQPPQAHENPEADRNAPQPPTRGERRDALTRADVDSLVSAWADAFNNNEKSWSKFVAWLKLKCEAAGWSEPNVDLAKWIEWTPSVVSIVKENLP